MISINNASIALIFAGLWGGGVTAQTQLKVTTPEELRQALVEPAAGLEILLAPGNYGNLLLHRLRATEAAPMILRSENPAAPARFSSMTLDEVQYVVLDSFVFDYDFEVGDPLALRQFQILSSRGVIVQDFVFDGDLAHASHPADNGFGSGIGLSVFDTSKLTIERNEFYDFHRGMVIARSSDLIVRGNNVHSVRSDGMNFAQVGQVLIEDNYIHDFEISSESSDHADMIQFWTNGTSKPSHNIMIRNNVLNSGQGAFTQSIFMRNDMVDRGLAGNEMFYRNVTIRDNVVINAHLHGITVGETDGLTISDNSVLRNSTSAGDTNNLSLWTPKITVASASQNVEISRNVTSRIDGSTGQKGWDVRENVLVQDSARMKPGFYGRVFVDQAIRDPSRLDSFAPRPGGPLDRPGIGAPRLWMKR